MDCLVLGPLQLSFAQRSATPSAPKLRQLLALLALNAEHTIGVPGLIRGLWDATPPQSAQNILQTYVVHLRRKIAATMGTDGRQAKEILVTTDVGYMLKPSSGYFDLREYRTLSREGANQLALNQVQPAFDSLKLALSHWRGKALADVAPSRVLAVEVDRLEESRLRTQEQYLDAALRLGRDREHLDELAVLCMEHPLNENFHFAYMVALYRSGLRVEALRAFRRLRDAMVGQLGLEPATRVLRLHAAVLQIEDESLFDVVEENPFGVHPGVLRPDSANGVATRRAESGGR